MELPPLLEPVIREFEAVGKQIYADGIWECDVGAIVLSHLCEKAGIEHTLQVGLFWWPDKAERFRLMEGRKPKPRELESYLADEHHHWVEVTDDRLSEPMLLDPNGEVRNEPRISLMSQASHYQPKPKLIDCSGVGPDTDPREAAEWIPKVAQALAIIDGQREPIALPEPSGVHLPQPHVEVRNK